MSKYGKKKQQRGRTIVQGTFWKGHILKKRSVLVVFSRSYTKKKENFDVALVVLGPPQWAHKTLSCPWAFKGGAGRKLGGTHISGKEETCPGPVRSLMLRHPWTLHSQSKQAANARALQEELGVFQGKAFPLVLLQLKITRWPTAASRLAYRETTISAQFTAFWGGENVVI